MARQINWPDTLQEIGYPKTWQPERVLKIMRRRRAAGLKTYTSAYLVRGGPKECTDKPEYTVNYVLDSVYQAAKKHVLPWEPSTFGVTLQESWEWLKQFPGWGPFTAYEVVTDLRHTRYLCNAPDIDTWANAGPGAKRGLNRLYNRPLREGFRGSQALDEMRLIFDWVRQHRNCAILPTLELRDVEMWLCETDKIARAKDAERTGTRCGLEIFHPPQKELL
jgi:hypothetical protein